MSPRRVNLLGFSYVEVLVSMALLAILLLPALDALTAGVRASANQFSTGSFRIVDRHLQLRNKMEDVLSRPFSDLYAETYLSGGNTTTSVSLKYSDLMGAANRRLVVLYRFSYSSGAITNNDSDLLFVKVYYEADGDAQEAALHTLTGK